MNSCSYRLDRQTRLAAIVIAAGTCVLLTTVSCLTPSVEGYGTHQQLGLPECQFFRLTGWKCPQCGMTTSFAFVVRGQIIQAWQANPCGPVLALVLSALVLPWSIIAGVSGQSLLVRDPGIVILWMAAGYVFIATAVWLIRSAIL